MFFSQKWNPDGLHIYVTGGSTGLGRSLAILLVKRGAHVSIVARNQERLDAALADLEAVRQNPNQKLKAFSFSLDSATESEKAFKAVCAAHDGQTPDAVFNCAGSSKPKFFVEMNEEELVKGMDNAYWVQAWTSWAAAREMVKQGRKGKIIFVSSTLGLMSFVGWASYAPGKHALRGLTETLQSELQLYNIDVHTYYPATIFTPGFEEENKTKPAITRSIEGPDDGVTPDQAASALFTGVQKGQINISGDLITSLFRASTRGSVAKNNFIVDGLLDFFAFLFVPVWRGIIDRQVRAHSKEHMEYLRSSRFFD